jgi:DNA-binding MarR family transcriptional regulator
VANPTPNRLGTMIPGSAQKLSTRTQRLRAALEYAERGWPVFPLAGKVPFKGTRGFHDATTDQSRITAWFNRWPDANLGIRTGKASGLLVIDIDEGGSDTLERLEREFGKLPQTLSVTTGRGFRHLYFRYPSEAGVEIRNSVRDLGKGFDVRGEGGYVVAPPSHTEGPYVWGDPRHPASLAELPPAWIDALSRKPYAQEIPRPSSAARHSAGEAAELCTDIDGPAILEGTRDDELTRIAGRLHDGTRTRGELTADLAAINEARCKPPLPEAQVLKIARSISPRPPCKRSSRASQAELAELSRIAESVARLEQAALSRQKKGMGGHSNWAVYRALVDFAKSYGREHPRGVEVPIDVRSLALAAGVGVGTVKRAIDRLTEKGLVFRSRSGGGKRAGAIVLIGAIVEHSNHLGVSKRVTRSECSTFAPIADFPLYRLRWGPGRLGKVCAAVLEAVASSAEGFCRRELARSLGRTPDSIKKPLKRLIEAGIIERIGRGRYRLSGDCADALARERELGGEPDAERRDIRRYNDNRRAYRDRHKVKPDRAATAAEMADRRESAPARRRESIERAVAALFRERPEHRYRRVGQITCALARYLESDFPRGVGAGGLPKDGEVAAILKANGIEAAA